MGAGVNIFFARPLLNSEMEVEFKCFGRVVAVKNQEFGGTGAVCQTCLQGDLKIGQRFMWLDPDQDILYTLLQAIVVQAEIVLLGTPERRADPPDDQREGLVGLIGELDGYFDGFSDKTFINVL